VRIETVVGARVRLKRQGTAWVGRCPFHDDRGRPNLVVFPATQTYKCFACGAQGDVIDFVARLEGVPPAQAVRRLTTDAGGPRPAAAPRAVRAPLAHRDAVYRALLAACPLSPAHRAALLARGLPPAVVDGGAYGTLPAGARADLAAAVARQGLALRGVPGFAVDARDGVWRVWGRAGLLIPVRDAAGRIQGVQVRGDAAAGVRYRWLSTPPSDRRAGGASSGAPCHVAGAGTDPPRTVWITEGPLKADVAAARLKAVVLGVPGVATWRAALPWLTAWRPRRVILAFDQDADPGTRAAVARQVAACAAAARARGAWVGVAQWTAGKGVDDALAAGHTLRIAAVGKEG
jgi:DNA primase